MPRITKPLEERRQEIIDTARKLFFEHGYDKTQISDISNNINVAQGLFYHYFKSKTEVLYAVIDEIMAEQMQTIKMKLDKQVGTAFDSLILLLKSPPNPENYGELIPSLIGDLAINEYCSKKMIVSISPVLTDLIERGNKDGSWSCENPEEISIFILQGIGGIMGISTLLDDDNSKLQAVMNIIYRILGVNPPR